MSGTDKKKRAVAMGVEAMRLDQRARWEHGDALALYGWRPAETREQTGGYGIIETYRSDVARAGQVAIDLLPSATTLRKYATAAWRVKGEHREGVTITAAYEACASDEPEQVIEAVRDDAGKVTGPAVRRALKKSPRMFSSSTAEDAAEALEDEAVADEVVKDKPAREAIHEAIARSVSIGPSSEPPPDPAEYEFGLELMQALQHAREALAQIDKYGARPGASITLDRAVEYARDLGSVAGELSAAIAEAINEASLEVGR